MEIRRVQNRAVEQVFQAGLEVADQVSVQKHVIRFTAGYVAMPHQDDAILRECPRLVGAQHVHPSEVLNRVQPLDDDLLTAHGERAVRQTYGNNHGQHLGSESHGHGQCKEKSPLPIMLGETVDEENQRHHHGHKFHH